ncbi:ATP-binding protein [Bifidobacterium longum]|uniref:ATP-binding protein n=1 Tax=Bifidobacterium longum TaxID=216816 RepID=UPI0021176C40|nr:ATP-binding protein [Bifidobacterium longum]
MARRQARRTIQAIPARAHGTLVRHGQHRVRPPPQLATKEWHRQLGGDTIADAILDRIVHNTIWINTGEYNMRQRHGQTTLDN